VEPDWDWCQQCGYDPDGLRPEGVEAGVDARASSSASTATRARRSRGRKKAPAVAVAPPATPAETRPLPPLRPTETVYGALPYDHPSSVVPVEPEEPDNSERINRRFAIVALCVIVIGLAVLVLSLLFG
jgi:hypothetical protein